MSGLVVVSETSLLSFWNPTGVQLRGRDAIYRSAKQVMESFMAKSYASYRISRVRFLKNDIAIAEIEQHPVTRSGELIEKEAGGLPTYVLNKNPEGGGWQIISAQNTLSMKIERSVQVEDTRMEKAG